VTKIYLVESIPQGDYYELIGIFSSKEKAKNAKDRWLEEWPQFKGNVAFEPIIIEIELDKYLPVRSLQ